jgi:serine/threonine-protein kinase
MSAPVAGEVLAGKYRVERVLGAGGMGVVILATHIHLEQKVAIKLLLPEALQNPEAIRRFVQEAKAAARIRGDHVVRVHDVGTLENGNPYLVMEYLEGEDLDALVRSRGRLPIEEAVDYVLQACEAIAEAHGVGIVHRDLKPANLFLAVLPDGARSIKVLDFGISKITPKAGAAASSVTKTRALMGSPLYMSPEQMRSTKSTTPKADVWALGVILYELLAGSPPFHGDTMPEICARVLAEPVPRLAESRPDAPPDLAAVLDLATQKEPAARCDVATFAQALAPFASTAGKLSAERVVRVARAVSATLLSQGIGVAPSLPSSVVGSLSPSAASMGGSLAISVSVSTPWEAGAGGPAQSAAGSAPLLPLETGSSVLSNVPARPATLATFGTTAPPQASRSLMMVAAGAFAIGVVSLALYLGLRGTGHASSGAAGVSSVAAQASSVGPLPAVPATLAVEPKPVELAAVAPAMAADAGKTAAVLVPAGVAATPATSHAPTVRPTHPPPVVTKPANPKNDNPFDTRFSN